MYLLKSVRKIDQKEYTQATAALKKAQEEIQAEIKNQTTVQETSLNLQNLQTNTLKEKNISYEEMEMILVGNHAPFTWGKTAQKAVYNSAVLESIAHMAFVTESIKADALRLRDSLIKKHYERKHGKDSYYGQ